MFLLRHFLPCAHPENSQVVDEFLRGDRDLVPSNAVVGLIVIDDLHYLMQLRSQKAGIFYPGHWGLFGGAVDDGEHADAALERELREELGIEAAAAKYFTEFSFDFGFCGRGEVWRRYYRIAVTAREAEKMVLGEGSEMRAFTAHEILTLPRLVPYDSFAIWLDATQRKHN
jgi:8-oxo-dGTP pyrophosphatase MutT (NUDIX family)